MRALGLIVEEICKKHYSRIEFLATHLLINVDDHIELPNDESQHVISNTLYTVLQLLHSVHNPQDDYPIITRVNIPKVLDILLVKMNDTPMITSNVCRCIRELDRRYDEVDMHFTQHLPQIIDYFISATSLGDDNESQFSYAPYKSSKVLLQVLDIKSQVVIQTIRIHLVILLRL